MKIVNCCRNILPSQAETNISLHCVYLVQWLSVGTHHMLYHNVAVNKVGPHPRGVEGGVGTVQECNAHNVIANMTFLVYLCVCVCVCGGGGGEGGGEVAHK